MAKINTLSETTSEYKVSVEITGDEYQERFDKELNIIAKSAKLDGFRQGKIPLTVIKKKFESQCHQKSISNLIDYHTKKINSEKKFDLIDSPSAKLLDAPSGEKNLSFEVTFNIMPDINIDVLKELKLDIPDVEINDEDIDKVINNIRKQNTTWTDSKKMSSDGDKVIVDYEGRIDGKEFKNNKQNDFSFIINDIIKGDPATVSLFKAFSESCVDKNINDETEVINPMPDDFPDKEIAGKIVKYKIKIKKILNGILPNLDSNFFSQLGISTEDESVFRDSVKTHMSFELKDKMTSKKYGIVNEELIKAYNFNLPEVLVKNQQMELEQTYATLKNSDENIDEKIKEIANKRVKLNIIYIKLAKEINTNISDQEAIDFCNEQSPSFRQFYAEKLKKDKTSTLLDVKNKMIENSIVEYVINNSKTNNTKMTFSEVMDG